jgi:hypothetical protein
VRLPGIKTPELSAPQLEPVGSLLVDSAPVDAALGALPG